MPVLSFRGPALPVADHLLEPADDRLGASPLRVASRFLPARPYSVRPGEPLGPMPGRKRSRCVGAIASTPLGTAVDRGDAMIAASGQCPAMAAAMPS